MKRDQIIEKNATEFLETEFQLTSVTERISEFNNKPQYIVLGTIIRHKVITTTVKLLVNKDSLMPLYWSIEGDNIPMSNYFIGKIDLGNKVVVSDPTYNLDVWCMTILDNVMPGVWDVNANVDTIDSWGERVWKLELTHATHFLSTNRSWQEICTLGVDSGTMSVFDFKHYKPSNEKFRTKCFDCVDTSERGVGLFQKGNTNVGAVCSSGVGDGSYPLDVIETDGKITAMRINFI